MAEPHSEHRFVSLPFTRRAPAEMLARAQSWYREIDARRSVRHFSDEALPEGVLEDCLRAAGSAPSGAHRQPWTFVVVRDASLKREIRAAAEAEERKLYEERISDEWRAALEPLGTDWHKEFLEHAPALIAVFRQVHGVEDGQRIEHYYTQESVGIACGFLLAALHHAGLATLTHTPSPMGFLQRILERPAHERAYLLIPVGFPTHDCRVPDLRRKPLEQFTVWR
jgi:nitroreductase